jgi:hypothetical protein
MQGHRQSLLLALLAAGTACGAGALAVAPTPAPAPVVAPGPEPAAAPEPAAPPEPATAPEPAPPPAVVEAAARADGDLAFCVEEVNRYRRRAGKVLLDRSTELDAFAAEGARVDSRARRAHRHFSTVTYPHPYVEMGENLIPWWPEKQYGTVREIIRVGLKGMWDEGPGGGHYENLVGNFTHVGCGIHIENGEVTVVQDFLRPPPHR